MRKLSLLGLTALAATALAVAPASADDASTTMVARRRG